MSQEDYLSEGAKLATFWMARADKADDAICSLLSRLETAEAALAHYKAALTLATDALIEIVGLSRSEMVCGIARDAVLQATKVRASIEPKANGE